VLAPPLAGFADRPYPRRWAALGVLSAALMLIVAANTALSVAVTDIQQDLGATSTETRWVLDAYPLAVAALLLLFGAVGDRYGRRGALNVGLVGFAAASVVGALAATPGELIAARAVLGVAGALIMPATLAYVRVLFPPEERRTAFTIWSGSSGVALVLGPLGAGALVETLGWQAVLWAQVPIALLALAAGALTVPASRNDAAPRIDVPGALLSTAVLGPLTGAIIEGPDKGWLSGLVLGLFAVSVLALAAFVAWERHTPSPMLDLSWFRVPGFRIGATLTVLGFTVAVGTMYVSILFLQQHELHGALRTGLELLPSGVGVVLGSALNHRLVHRFGARVPTVMGLVIMAAGSLIMVLDHSGYEPIGLALGVVGLGTGLFIPNVTEAVMNGAPHHAGGVAGATADVAVELGAALGVAIFGSLLTSGYDSRLGHDVDRLPEAAREAVTDSLYGAHVVAAQLPPDLGHALIGLADSAFQHGLVVAAVAAVALALGTAALALRLPHDATVSDPEPEDLSGVAVVADPALA
jgi:EmrB/QacA subfamily drug resistance transporter